MHTYVLFYITTPDLSDTAYIMHIYIYILRCHWSEAEMNVINTASFYSVPASFFFIDSISSDSSFLLLCKSETFLKLCINYQRIQLNTNVF